MFLFFFRKYFSIDAMRLLIQRIESAEVRVDAEIVGRAGRGLCLFVGVALEDKTADADFLAEKAIHLRIFKDDGGKLNRSVSDIHGDILVVSEFTLYGDCGKGRRPSFSRAAPPEKARELYEYFVGRLKESGLRVATGRFQTAMAVSLVNDGPVTLILES